MEDPQATQDNVQAEEQDTPTEAQNQDASQEPEGKLSQADVDAIVEKRLARERKKLRSTIESEEAEKARRARMDETQRLQVERDDAEKKATAVVERANQRIVKAEARAVAASSGVAAEKLSYVVRLAELDGVDVDSDTGEPDVDAIQAAISKVLTDIPELAAKEQAVTKGAPDASRTGGDKAVAGDFFNTVLRQRGLAPQQ